jgi:hypothetical protein
MNSAFKEQLRMQNGPRMFSKGPSPCSSCLGPPFICSKGSPQWQNVHTLRCKAATGISYLTTDGLGQTHLMRREVSV